MTGARSGGRPASSTEGNLRKAHDVGAGAGMNIDHHGGTSSILVEEDQRKNSKNMTVKKGIY